MDIELMLGAKNPYGVTTPNEQYRREWYELQTVARLERQLEIAKKRVAMLPRRLTEAS